MNSPSVYKSNFGVVLVTLVQALLPGTVAAGSLLLCALAFGFEPDDSFMRFCALVFVMSAVVMQSPRVETAELIGARSPIVVSAVLQWVVVLVLLLVIGYATKTANLYSRVMMSTWALLVPPLQIGAYLGLHSLMRRAMSHPGARRRAVFAGCNELTLALSERVRVDSTYGLAVDGFFDDRGAERLGMSGNARLLGRLPELAEYVRRSGTDVIFIALPIRHISRVMNLLDDLRDTTASIYYVPDIFVFDLIQARTSAIGGIPVVAMCETPFHGYRGFIKRGMDLAISAALLVMLSPLMLAMAMVIKFNSHGPVLFRQRRYGLDGNQIEVYKFRTMTVMEDGQHVRQATRDDDRVTSVGRVLRRYSLDELPQLINVLQGTMSLVGPRPHAVAHNEQYRKLIKGYMVRHKVLPGVTGLAQVNGCRGEIARVEDMEQRLSFDLEYLRRWTPLLDVNILFLTLLRMFGDKRAY